MACIEKLQVSLVAAPLRDGHYYVMQVRSSQYGGTIRAFNGYPSAPGPALLDAVDHALRRVCHFLIEGELLSNTPCKTAAAERSP